MIFFLIRGEKYSFITTPKLTDILLKNEPQIAQAT